MRGLWSPRRQRHRRKPRRVLVRAGRVQRRQPRRPMLSKRGLTTRARNTNAGRNWSAQFFWCVGSGAGYAGRLSEIASGEFISAKLSLLEYCKMVKHARSVNFPTRDEFNRTNVQQENDTETHRAKRGAREMTGLRDPLTS